MLDFDQGEEELGWQLRAQYGAAPVHLGKGPPPRLSIELSPRPAGSGPALRLWGEPDLLGFTLDWEGEHPSGIPGMPMLEVLWETGRIRAEEVVIRRLGDHSRGRLALTEM